MALSRNACLYCANPRSRSHAAMSTLASPTRSLPLSFTLVQTTLACEYSGAVLTAQTLPWHRAAIAVVIRPCSAGGPGDPYAERISATVPTPTADARAVPYKRAQVPY
jgi:hypothetical protein